MVEFQPSKLAVVGSNPIARSKMMVRGRQESIGPLWFRFRRMGLVSEVTHDVSNAHVAQLVEHVLGKDEVTRSIRVVGSIPCDREPA